MNDLYKLKYKFKNGKLDYFVVFLIHGLLFSLIIFPI